MRCRVLADLAADSCTHLGAVAPVHAAPHPCVALIGMNLIDAGVVPNRAAIALERQRELIGAEPLRVEPQYTRADRSVGRGIFGVGWGDDERRPRRLRFGLGVVIGIAGTDGSDRAPEH